MQRFVLCVFWTFSLFQLSQQDTVKQYRKDYEYNALTDAFYKLHRELTSTYDAKNICKAEGGKLIAPSSPQDIAQARKMMFIYPAISYIMLDDEDPPEHEFSLADLLAKPDKEGDKTLSHDLNFSDAPKVVSRSGQILQTKRSPWMAFVCKVEAKDAEYNPICDVFGKDYEFVSNVSSCYKVPDSAATWDEAKTECEKEGAHLVVINSETENEVVRNIFNAHSAPYDASFDTYFYLGFGVDPNDESRVFKTVLNQTLEEAGFVRWREGEPNNLGWKPENCGSMWVPEGTFNDINCRYKLGYVCEKDVISNDVYTF